MANEGQPITPAELEALTTRSAGEALRDHWQPACAQCLHVNRSTMQFCQQCGAPMTHITVYAPLERVYTFGLACRNMVEGQARFSVILGAWLMFGHVVLLPLLVISMLIFAGIAGTAASSPSIPSSINMFGETWHVASVERPSPEGISEIPSLLLGVFVLSLEGTILYQATHHWLRKRHQTVVEGGAAESSSDEDEPIA